MGDPRSGGRERMEQALVVSPDRSSLLLKETSIDDASGSLLGTPGMHAGQMTDPCITIVMAPSRDPLDPAQ